MIEALLQYLNSLDSAFDLLNATSVGGGCINQTFRVTGKKRDYFLKLNRREASVMFEAEYEGLVEIRGSNTMMAPKPIEVGVYENQSFLIMEYCPIQGSGDWVVMGRRLAEMHQFTKGEYGWFRDNTIGATPQINQKKRIGWLSSESIGCSFNLSWLVKKG